MTLDTTITPGQLGHITDHDELHTQINALEAAIATVGNLPIATAAGVLGDLAPGSLGQVLTADPAVAVKAKWATPTAGGGFLYDVTTYGAVSGGSAATNKAAFTACQNALAASTYGGTFYIPAGLYDVGDFAFVLPLSSSKAVHLRGDGIFATFLKRSVDGAAGTYFISASGTTGAVFSTISEMHITGPGSFSPDGAVAGTEVWGPTNPHLAVMDGIRLQSFQAVSNVVVIEFAAGVVETADHIKTYNLTCVANLDGIRIDAGVTRDDITHVNPNLTNNARSGWRIASGSANAMAGTTVIRGHVGYGPYGITIAAGDAAYTIKMAQVQFIGTSWEALGNGAINDEGMTSLCDFVLDGCRPFSINNALYGLPTSTAPYMFHIGAIGGATGGGGLEIRGGTYMAGYGSVPSTAYFFFNAINAPMTWDGSWWVTLASAIANSKAFIVCAAPVCGVFLRAGSASSGGDYMGMETVRAHSVSGTITQGNLVEEANSGGFAQVKRNTGIGVASGVAINGPTVTNELCVVGQHADRMLVDTVDGSVTIGHVLVADGTTVYKVTALARSAVTAGQQVVGQVNNTTITSGRISARVRL